MKEIWLDIEGYEGIYKISNFGKVLSVRRNKIVKPYKANGYDKVSLSINDKKHRFYVHRLVAIYFVENQYSKPCVNHIDGNKDHNCYANLEWVTYKENDEHARKNKLIDPNKPVLQINRHSKEIVKEFISISEAYRETNIPQSNIVHVCKGKNKTAGGYIWKYA